MKVLLIGNGAREHVIAETLKKSPQCKKLLVYGDKRNPGIEKLASVYRVGELMDLVALKAFAEEERPDFAVVGPEAPLAAGAVDTLAALGVPSVGPTQKLAQIESSKGFTRNLLLRQNIPGNPRFRVFTRTDVDTEAERVALLDFCRRLGEFVVKADGLHGGKGVKVMGDHFKTAEEGAAFALECVRADGQVVIEEKLVGQEFSLMSFCDGETVIDMPPVQDHKRAYEGDSGPNTGGMGSYSTGKHLPFLTARDLEQAHQITVRVAMALKEEMGAGYKGILYGGFIAVKDGVRLIEYNARFGDPEAMNVLPILKSDFVDICQAMIDGKLRAENVQFEDRATVVKYVVPKGYPDQPEKGGVMTLGDLPKGCHAYYASVNDEAGKIVMSGSRAVGIVGIARTVAEAEELAQQGVEGVTGPIFYRKDIGTAALIEKRVEMMKELRE